MHQRTTELHPNSQHWHRFKRLNQQMSLGTFQKLVKVTRQDLAKIWGTSLSTVDRYLANPSKLSAHHRRDLYQFYRCCVYREKP